MNDDMILTLESELSYNHCPNLLESDFESPTIRFGDPNRLSLLTGIQLQIYVKITFLFQAW